MRTLIAAGLAAALLAVSPAAEASVLTYTLQDTLFSDGATATGSFVLDTGTDAVSAVGITLSGTPTGTMTFSTGAFQTGQYAYDQLDSISFPGDAATPGVFVLYVNGHFIAEPGTQSLVQNSSDGTGTFYCDGNCDYIRGLSGDSTAALVASAVPEPSTLILLGSSLVAVGARRRRAPASAE